MSRYHGDALFSAPGFCIHDNLLKTTVLFLAFAKAEVPGFHCEDTSDGSLFLCNRVTPPALLRTHGGTSEVTLRSRCYPAASHLRPRQPDRILTRHQPWTQTVVATYFHTEQKQTSELSLAVHTLSDSALSLPLPDFY